MPAKHKSPSRSSEIDWPLLASYLALVVVGLLMIYTTTYDDYYQKGMWSLSSPFGAQFLWATISIIFLFIISFIDWHVWNTLSLPSYVISIIFLILVLLIGTQIKGARSWLTIGPWSLQPSEFAKIGVALFCSSLLSSIQIKLSNLKTQFLMVVIMLFPALLIILQPDPGTAITFISLLIVYFRFGMPAFYYLAGITLFLTIIISLVKGFFLAACTIILLSIFLTTKYSRKEFVYVFSGLTLLLVNIIIYQFGQVKYAVILNIVYLIGHLFLFNRQNSLYSRLSVFSTVLLLSLISFSSSFAFENILRPHQQDRINVWLQPEKCDPQGSLYNLLQSKLAIGSGGLTGKGYLNGTLTKLNYVPEQTTDFIFSSIGEEQGFIGSISVVLLFLILTLRLIRIGEQSKYNFIKAYCYAIGGFVFIHFFINIGMTMGISPVIGIPLPFISKGGSALLSFSIMIGIALNMSKSR